MTKLSAPLNHKFRNVNCSIKCTIRFIDVFQNVKHFYNFDGIQIENLTKQINPERIEYANFNSKFGIFLHLRKSGWLYF